MNDTTAQAVAVPSEEVRTADGVPLKLKLRRVERHRRAVSMLLVAPLFLFLITVFVVPIVGMIYKSVDNPVLLRSLPHTMAAIKTWDGAV